MKKTILAALAAACLASPLWAAPADFVQPFKSVSAANRVAIIYPSRWDALNQAAVNSQKISWIRQVGNLEDMLREQGAEVHRYYSEYFWRSTDHHNLWYTFGTYYATTVIAAPGMENPAQATVSFLVNPDSTTTHLIAVGGADLPWDDSTFTGARNISNGGSNTDRFTTWNYIKGGVVPYADTRDTLYSHGGSLGLRCVSLPASISKVVRLFHPVALTANSFIATGTTTAPREDSVLAVMPATFDSTAAASEIMPYAWRVYRAATGRSMEWVKLVNGGGYKDNVGHIVYALVARTTVLRPIKIACEWDDVFDVNPTSKTPAAPALWGAAIDRSINRWGLKPAISVRPIQPSYYAYAGFPAGYSGADFYDTQSENWKRFFEKYELTWIHHSHDSTSRYDGNLVGRFGGYSPDNGSNAGAASGSNSTQWLYTHKFASRYDDSEDTTAYQYGIVQALRFSKSIRLASLNGRHRAFVPPYLSFCNNEVLPVDWKYRPNAQRTSWIGGRMGIAVGYPNYPTLPLDSLWWAFAEGTDQPTRSTFYVRGLYWNTTGAATDVPAAQRPWGQLSIYNTFAGSDRDSNLAFTPFIYPDEVSGCLVNGRLTTIRNIGTVSFDGLSSSQYRSSSQGWAAILMGMRNPVQTGTNTGSAWSNEAWAIDPSQLGQVNGGTMRNFSASQRFRMVYLHPGSGFTNAQETGTSYFIDAFESGLLQTLEGVGAIAGHKLHKWVYPWELYSK